MFKVICCMSFHKSPWGFIYVFAQKLNFIIFIYLMKKLFQYLKVMSKLQESMAFCGENFAFLFQSLNKRGDFFSCDHFYKEIH